MAETDRYNTLGIPENQEETAQIIEAWVSDNRLSEIYNYTFAIEQASDNRFIGLLGLKLGHPKYQRAEVWYKLHPDYWRNGFGAEAVIAVLGFGFGQLKLHRIEAGCAVDNVASVKLLEKVGMTREGRKRKVLPLQSGWSDNYEFAMLETDWVKIASK